ncbi:serine protease 27-like [Lissotriton helveticus]
MEESKEAHGLEENKFHFESEKTAEESKHTLALEEKKLFWAHELSIRELAIKAKQVESSSSSGSTQPVRGGKVYIPKDLVYNYQRGEDIYAWFTSYEIGLKMNEVPEKNWECGKPMSGTHTENADVVLTGEWPWQVNILANGIHMCGGTLISEKWVVSAAQCFLYFSLSTITVVLGTSQLYYSNPAPVTSRVLRIITNPMYSGEDRSVGDISLLELQTPLTYTDAIRPVCLPAAVQFPTGMKCWVTGWGQVQISLPTIYQQMLQEFELPLIDAHNCDAIYHMFTAVGRNVTIIPNTTICTRSKRGATNSCPGDSGGPLVCQLGNTWVLAGIASFSSGCALPNRPAVYTLVSAYTEWIVRHVPEALTNVVNIQLLPITEIVPTFPTGSGNSFTSSMVVILGIGLFYVFEA